MEIIKQGNPNWNKNPKVFTCSYCGCVFIAIGDEYAVHGNYFTDMNYYTCHCPCCNNRVSLEE